MSTSAAVLQLETISDVEWAFKEQCSKSHVTDVHIYRLDEKAVRIDTPLERLTAYRFLSNPSGCSWTFSEIPIFIPLKSFTVLQQHAHEAFWSVDLQEGSPLQGLMGPKHEVSSNLREIFFERSLRALEGLKSLDESNLMKAVAASTDYSVLVAALSTEEALATMRLHDPLAGARLRGVEAKRKLLESEGGAISAAGAAKLLRVTRQAVDKRRREGKLLGLQLGKKGYHYPCWQFGLEGLEEVLAAVNERDFWEQLSFFVNPSALLRDRTPLEILREGKKNIKEVVKAAKNYGEQGG